MKRDEFTGYWLKQKQKEKSSGESLLLVDDLQKTNTETQKNTESKMNQMCLEIQKIYIIQLQLLGN